MLDLRGIGLAAAVVAFISSNAVAGVADVLRDPRFRHLGLAPIAPVLASTVASTYPVASSSSSVSYVYNPAVDALERRAGVAGPIIGERAETIGPGRFDLVASYEYVRLASVGDENLDSLVNRRRVKGRMLVFPVKGGVTLADGRFTNFLPVRVKADLDVEAHIVSPSLTYGITPDFDVNLVFPLMHTSLAVTADTQVPDPRFPEFALRPGDPNARRGVRSASDDATGIGDLLVRAKYVVFRSSWADVAAALALALPTGNERDLQGTGTTHVQPALVLSRTFAGRLEPLLDVGLDIDAGDPSRAVVRWALGGTVQLLDAFSVSVVGLGRHELDAPVEPIPLPFFFQLERADYFDLSVGMRWRFAEDGLVSLNAVVPLGQDGLLAEAIPFAEVDWAF